MVVLNMLCSEGRSRVFDEAANGYVRAEAVAAILLSRYYVEHLKTASPITTVSTTVKPGPAAPCN